MSKQVKLIKIKLFEAKKVFKWP